MGRPNAGFRTRDSLVLGPDVDDIGNETLETNIKHSLVCLAKSYAAGPVLILTVTQYEDKFYTGPTDMQKSVAHPTKFFIIAPFALLQQASETSLTFFVHKTK